MSSVSNTLLQKRLRRTDEDLSSVANDLVEQLRQTQLKEAACLLPVKTLNGAQGVSLVHGTLDSHHVRMPRSCTQAQGSLQGFVELVESMEYVAVYDTKAGVMLHLIELLDHVDGPQYEVTVMRWEDPIRCYDFVHGLIMGYQIHPNAPLTGIWTPDSYVSETPLQPGANDLYPKD